MQTEKTFIYGKHPVREALRARPDVVQSVYFEDGNDTEDIRSLVTQASIQIKSFNKNSFPSAVSKDAVHQGVLAEIDTSKLVHQYDTFISKQNITNDTGFVVLGEVNDPQNVGAIIRSATAFGLTAVLIPEHRQVQVNGTVIKASVGMAFKIPLVSISNVNNVLSDLKKRGCWVYGLDGEAPTSVTEEHFEKASVFVLGNEGRGIREKTLENCDILLNIPIRKDVESLNASVAAGVVFYAWKSKK